MAVRIRYRSGSPFYAQYGDTYRYIDPGTTLNGSDGPFRSIDVSSSIASTPHYPPNSDYRLLGGEGHPYDTFGGATQLFDNTMFDGTPDSLTMVCNGGVSNDEFDCTDIWINGFSRTRVTGSPGCVFRYNGITVSGQGAVFIVNASRSVGVRLNVKLYGYVVWGSSDGVQECGSIYLVQSARLDWSGYWYFSGAGSAFGCALYGEDNNILLAEAMGAADKGSLLDLSQPPGLLDPSYGYVNGGRGVAVLVECEPGGKSNGIALFNGGRSRLGGGHGTIKVVATNGGAVDQAVACSDGATITVQPDYATQGRFACYNAGALTLALTREGINPAWVFDADHSATINCISQGSGRWGVGGAAAPPLRVRTYATDATGKLTLTDPLAQNRQGQIALVSAVHGLKTFEYRSDAAGAVSIPMPDIYGTTGSLSIIESPSTTPVIRSYSIDSTGRLLVTNGTNKTGTLEMRERYEQVYPVTRNYSVDGGSLFALTEAAAQSQKGKFTFATSVLGPGDFLYTANALGHCQMADPALTNTTGTIVVNQNGVGIVTRNTLVDNNGFFRITSASNTTGTIATLRVIAA
jgi:hypothetical protein